IAVEARSSEYVDSKSGVSARLTISAYENLLSAVERRVLINNESKAVVRLSDFYGLIPSITGKVELVYEGEQEGPAIVAQDLIGKAIRSLFINYFPDPDKVRKLKERNPYKHIIDWFGEGHELDLLNDISQKEYRKTLDSVPGLKELVNKNQKDADEDARFFLMEFALHGLTEYSMLSKKNLVAGLQFKDLLSSMFSDKTAESGEEDKNEG
ncbi:MAG TPA: hypothetical protein VI583_05470, partial [Cyclobacteriaceae bacterium]|nr:hypothetical protein [Cyclobacteriaceae bacterium]